MSSPLLFLLGLQRSGSTWLSNIFDSHSSTAVFMEPFAPAYGIFPEFPASSYFLEESTPALDQLLSEQLSARLSHYKYLLSPRSARTPALFKVERALTNAILRGRAVVSERLWARARKTYLLNLNRMDAHALLVEKTEPPATWVIKELRLAGKVPVLRRAFPEARFVVLLRHPGANVHAMMSWFQRGRLTELRRMLQVFPAEFAAQTAADPYREQLALCRSGSLPHAAALYWRVSNETMVRKLGNDARSLVLTYEALASQPLEMTTLLLDFAALTPEPGTLAYVKHSSTSAVSEASPITTLRESASHYRTWQGEISGEVAEAVHAITHDSPLLDRFANFYA